MTVMSSSRSYISKRAEADVAHVNHLKAGIIKQLANPYHKVDNPKGIISLGVAENILMQDELVQKLPTLFSVEKKDLVYGTSYGSDDLRTYVAGFFNKYFNTYSPVDKDHITVVNGVGPAINALSFVLCDPGDALMVSAPYYGAFEADVTIKAQSKIVVVELEGTSPFDVDHLDFWENAYQKARNEGVNVRAMIICNPHNPLGRCYNRAILERLIRFASKHNIHIIFDEVFALSVFDQSKPENAKSDPFTSVLSLDNLSSLIDPALVHVVYGISKDFCMNGLRCGFHIAPWNPQVVKAMQAIADFSWISSTTDTLVTKMLEDETWVDWFIKTNQRRLAESYEQLTQFLRLHNINYFPAQAGHFIWVDLRSFLPKPTGPNPHRHAAERSLYNSFLEHGVYIARGEAFHAEVEGLFRLTFAMDWETLHEGLRRMVVVLGGNVNGINSN